MHKLINKMDIAIEAEIQIGDKTHHQDQSILSNNFNTIKTIVKAPLKLNPLLEFIFVVFFINLCFIN